MKDHLTDLETSRRFKEVGIEKESKYSWFQEKPSKNENVHSYNYPQEDIPFELFRTEKKYLSTHQDLYNEIVPAYLLSELLEMVEGDWGLNYDAPFIGQQLVNKGIAHFSDGTYFSQADTPIAAVAQAILWQKEQL